MLTVEFTVLGHGLSSASTAGRNSSSTRRSSFQVYTDDQEETDRYWNAIVDNGGEESMCGWCKDRFGLSWQITPKRLMELMSEQDPAKAKRAFKAMMTMQKIDIAALERAVEEARGRCVSSPARSSSRSTASCRRRAGRTRIRPATSASAAGRIRSLESMEPVRRASSWASTTCCWASGPTTSSRLTGRTTRTIPIGEKFQRINKYVLTHSDEPLEWENSHRLSGDTAEAVAELKRSEGRDLLIQGSSTLYPPLLSAAADRPADRDDLPGRAGPRQAHLRRIGRARRAEAGRPFRLRTQASIIATYEPAGDVQTGTFATKEPSEAEHARQAKMKEGAW